MRHKKRTIHKNKHNNTRKNPLRNMSKQSSRKYKSLHRKTMKMRGGSDVLAKAYGAVQKGLSSVGSVFDPRETEPDIQSREDVVKHMHELVQIPMPKKKFTNPEYSRMIEFQRRFIDLLEGIRSSKIKSPYTPFTTLLQNIVDFNKQMPSYKHYDFLIGYYPNTSAIFGLKIIDFSGGDNQLPAVIRLYVTSTQFADDYATKLDIDAATNIKQDIFDQPSYIAGIANDQIYNYKPSLIGLLDAIYYCIPDKTICLELTRRLHGIDPHIVERVSPLTWTTPLCTAVSFLDDKKVVVELMELIKSNQITQKALFHYSEDSYYPTIDDDNFRENGINLIGDRIESVKMYILIKNIIGVGSNPDGSKNTNVIVIRNSTKYVYEMLDKFWEKYKGYLMKFCIESDNLGLPLSISHWLGAEEREKRAVEEEQRKRVVEEAERKRVAEEQQKAAKATKRAEAEQKKAAKAAEEAEQKKAEEEKARLQKEEKDRVRLEQAMKREEAEQKKAAKAVEDAERKRVAAKAEAEQKRIVAAEEAERKKIADEEKKVAKAAKKAQKKAEEALAATAAAEAAAVLAAATEEAQKKAEEALAATATAEEARAREKQRLSARTPPFVEPKPEEYSEKYSKMEESQGASQSIEMEDATQFRSLAEPIPAGPKVANVYPDLQGLRMLGVNTDSIIASTMGLLQPYIDSDNINGVCGLITSKITNYTLKNDMYYNFMSCVIFIILGQLTNLLKTTKYRLILKGSKALQVAFANTIDTKPYLISDDIDILLVPADREAVQTKPGMYTDSGIVAGDICSMIEFIIKSALPPGLSGLISVLNPMKQFTRNPNVFKISHLEPNERRFSVIADIDIRYTKNAAMIFSQEDEHLSRIGFPIMSEDRSFDVFYNPNRMFYTTIDIPNIQLEYLHQTKNDAFEEKIYYYIKYILLKNPYNDNSFLLDKFKKSIIAILNYTYFMIPQARRKKIMNYSEEYITNFLSPYPNQKYYLNLVLNTLFAGKSAGGL